MSLVKVFVQVVDMTSGDTGLGLDYKMDVLENLWRQYINVPDRSFFVYPSNDSIASEALWKAIGTDASTRVNNLLIAAGQSSLAVCTFEDVMVYGFGDWKFGSPMLDVENIFTGLRERVRRIPRNLGGISQLVNAQDTIPLLNNEQRSLECSLQFNDTPVLGTDLEYREFLYVYPADLTDLDGLDSVLLDTIVTGPPYILKGRRAWQTIHPTLLTGEQIHGVIGLRRKNTLAVVTPTDAGTISRASNSWVLSSANWDVLQLGSRLRAWYSGNQITGGVNGTGLGTWQDVSGNALNAVQGTAGDKPIYNTNRLNSLPGVDFVTADYMPATGLSSSNISQSVACVVDLDTAATTMTILGASNNGGWHLAVSAARQPFINKANITNIGTSTGTITLNSPAVIIATTTSTTWEISINGTVSSGSHAVSLTAALTAVIGAQAAGTLPWDGEIFDLVVSDALDTTSRQFVEGRLAWKYNLQANLPSTHPYKNAAPRY